MRLGDSRLSNKFNWYKWVDSYLKISNGMPIGWLIKALMASLSIDIWVD